MTTARDRRKERSPFESSRGIEGRFAMRLRALANKIGALIDAYPDVLTNTEQQAKLNRALNAYSDTITPWAQDLAGRMVREVDVANRRAYAAHSRAMSRNLRIELEHAPTGEMMRLMRAESVELIRSLPTEAAARVQRIAMQNLLHGERASELSKQIMRSSDVTKARANLIARTETSRTSSNLTMARAVFVGSVEYDWETSRDSDVRPSHAKMQGQVVRWADPPTLDGLRGHAGCLPNCRCYPAPRLPEFK